MSSDIMCNGHRFVKSSLFQSPGYLADLSPYIDAVISSKILAAPIQLTASAIRPLAPLAKSILPARATNFILNSSLICEYCLYQVCQNQFDDGQLCPSKILDDLGMADDQFIMADRLLEAQDEAHERGKQDSYPETNPGTSRGTHSDDSLASGSTTSKQTADPSTSSENCNRSQLVSPLEISTESSESRRKRKQLYAANFYKNDLLIMRICPEIGLHAQSFSCIDCDKDIDLNSARLCHYDGRYYCHNCHTGSDLSPIPARVLRNWDFTPKPVSKSSLQKICYLRTRPVLFDLFQINSMLYGFIDRLVELKQIRERIQSMLKYLEVCGQPNKPYLIPVPKHLLDPAFMNFFTLNDLFDVNQVHNLLCQLQTTLETHIVLKCESCRGKGFYCELCKDPNDILYPFSKNGSVCDKCHSVYHKNCFHRKKKNCPRCVRINTKRSSLSTIESSVSLNTSEPG